MRIAFAGTPEFARVALARLLASSHELVLVLTQPDRPAGRGLKLQASPVKLEAIAHGVPVLQPRGLRLDGKYADEAAAARQALLAARPDVMIVAAYGLILPDWTLSLPAFGCLNIHASLLPRWRGAAPIHRAIEAGDACSGITIMQMDAGLDTGDMLLAEAIDILPDDSTGSLHDRLALLGASLLEQVLPAVEAGRAVRRPQPQQGITYAQKIDKSESLIDWSGRAVDIERRIRAFHPAPGASTWLQGEVIKVWAARPGAALSGPPGRVLQVSDQAISVACGEGCIDLTQLQRAGAKRMSVREFLQGHRVEVGQRFHRPDPA